jgi:hypothetical protein
VTGTDRFAREWLRSAAYLAAIVLELFEGHERRHRTFETEVAEGGLRATITLSPYPREAKE